ncbi:MAG: hypothetical protein ACI87E_000316 [Mariniblastus sp.]|jgi:hypothetical protein
MFLVSFVEASIDVFLPTFCRLKAVVLIKYWYGRDKGNPTRWGLLILWPVKWDQS